MTAATVPFPTVRRALETLELELSTDRKVSPLSRWAQGKARWEPRVRNTLGLPAGRPADGGTCPGATEGEGGCIGPCYAAAMPWPSVHKLLARNLAALEHAGTELGMVDLLDTALARYRAEHDRWIPDAPKQFRIHWSGDFYSPTYAAAWARVIAAHPDVRFWAYTRTFAPWALEPLADLPNLSLYLSADDVNKETAHATASLYGLPIATMSTDRPDPRPDAGRPVPCPVDVGRRPMVADDGTGGCIACQLCPAGQRDIWFPTR